MAVTLAQEIEALDAAIAKAEAAQSSTGAGGASVTRANLAVLYQRRDALNLRFHWATYGRVRAVEIP